MKTDKKDQTPVIWKTTYQALKKRWIVGFILANLCYLIIIGLMGWSSIQERKTREFFILQKQELDALKTKQSVYAILRNRGVSLGQGLDIAEVAMRQSRKLDLSMSLILAVMKKESEFTPYALSSENAMGLMQVHPITWGEYVGKLNLKVSAHAAFDPVTNIIVATNVLRDLYEYYKKTGKSEEEVWKSVLSAYYAGMTSLAQTGMTASHLKYVADITRFKDEFDEKF